MIMRRICPLFNFSSRFSDLNPLQLQASIRMNSNRASIARINRQNYLRMYPTLVVQPDGSTINIRYKEPRAIIHLPLDLSTLTEEQQRARVARRKPKTVVKVQEEVTPDFNPSAYVGMMKKKKK